MDGQRDTSGHDDAIWLWQFKRSKAIEGNLRFNEKAPLMSWTHWKVMYTAARNQALMSYHELSTIELYLLSPFYIIKTYFRADDSSEE
jgi:hypothetical protein